MRQRFYRNHSFHLAADWQRVANYWRWAAFLPLEDAWEKIAAGASLLQIYTGWIYEGPWMVRRILEGLATRLQERGLSKLTDAIGIGN